ncbi:hypothetical protein BJ684DRAFT_4234, partial [Piptocephalis cylindrospora]
PYPSNTTDSSPIPADLPTTDPFSTAYTHSGKGTFYQVKADACGTHSRSKDLVAAISRVQFGRGKGDPAKRPWCQDRCAHVTGPLGNVTVRIVDICEDCKHGDLDFSHGAYDRLGKRIDGIIPISWK